jgi:hypothetical protein
MDYRTIPIRVICRFYQSLPYRDTANIPLTPTESVISILLGLSDPPIPPLYTRLPYRPFIMVPNTVTTAYPSAFRLAGSQIRRILFPRRRD